MPHHDAARSVLRLAHRCSRLDLADPLTQCLTPRSCSRGFATPTNTPNVPNVRIGPQPGQFLSKVETSTPLPTGTHNPLLKHPPRVLTTLHSWPSLEPTRFGWYDAKYLDMPLRRDILHRAVIYEGDATRQGSASTKHRSEVHGSNRKVLPQKGTGKARAGDKKSPIRRGGGVAHGPKPRDFSTGLQRKVYDMAWRTALSHRYRRDELKIIDGVIDLPQGASTWFMDGFFEAWAWGKGNGRTLLVADSISDELKEAMANLGHHGLVKDIEDVDVKDLLEMGRVVIERRALDALFVAHSSDIHLPVQLNLARLHAKEGWQGPTQRYAEELNVSGP
ncbi:hypothetical protein DV738_g5233, partial [Chaetothyriales sp. CBS 135597]